MVGQTGVDAGRASYEGGAFSRQLEGSKASGELTVLSSRLLFSCSEQHVELPLEGLQIKRGGAADRLVFFTHPSFPGWSVFTPDRGILQDPHLLAHGGSAGQIAMIKRKKVGGALFTAAVLVVAALLIWGLFALKDPLVAVVAGKVPVSLEQKLGETVFKSLKMNHSFIDDPELVGTLEELALPLLEVIEETSPYEFRFHIVTDDTVNAFAIPGGDVVFHRGLLLKAESPGEVMGVLAHEISHVSRRHSMRKIIESIGLFTLVQAFFGDVSGIAAVFVDSGAQLLSLKFSREFEREADDRGWEYLVGASIDPRGMIDFFSTLAEQEKNRGLSGEVQGKLSFISTHPSTQDRIEYLRDKLKKVEGRSWDDLSHVDFRRFQETLRGSATDNKGKGEEEHGFEN